MTTIEVVTYPWETAADVERERAEAEILADVEFAQWLNEVYAEPDVEEMGELEFLAYMADQLEARPAAKMLSLAEQTLMMVGWELLPDWQREDYVGE